MSTPDTTTDAFAATRGSTGDALVNGSAILGFAFASAVTEQGRRVGRVERGFCWLTDRTYRSARVVSPEGVDPRDATAAVDHNFEQAVVRRAAGVIAAAGNNVNRQLDR